MDSVSGATAVGSAMWVTKEDQHQAPHQAPHPAQAQTGTGRQLAPREKAVPGWPEGLVNSSTGVWASRGHTRPSTIQTKPMSATKTADRLALIQCRVFLQSGGETKI